MSDKVSFFESYFDAVRDFPPEEYKKALNAFFEYCFEGIEPEGLTGMSKVFFCMAKPIVDKGKKTAANGENGGRSASSKEDENQKQDTEEPTGSEKNNQLVSEKKPTGSDAPRNRNRSRSMDKEQDKGHGLGTGTGERNRTPDKDNGVCVGTQPARSRAFHAPTIEQVREYCVQRHNTVDAERFVDYYQSNGWKVGKNPMKDWQAAVRTWERGDNGGQGYKPAERSGTTRQSPLDVAAEVMRRIADEGKESAYDTRGNQ